MYVYNQKIRLGKSACFRFVPKNHCFVLQNNGFDKYTAKKTPKDTPKAYLCKLLTRKKNYMKKVILTSLFCVLLLFGCQSVMNEGNKEEDPENSVTGQIIGYTKCSAGRDCALIGLFIITEKTDSLLSFNIPLSSLNIDPGLLKGGAYNMRHVSINFAYRIAVGEEIKTDFLCPQNDMVVGFSRGLVEDYKQIIITEYKIETP